jgi:hypothetical protein
MYSDSNPLSPTGLTTRRTATVDALYQRLEHYRFLMVRSCPVCSKRVLIPPLGSRDAGQRQINPGAAISDVHTHEGTGNRPSHN